MTPESTDTGASTSDSKSSLPIALSMLIAGLILTALILALITPLFRPISDDYCSLVSYAENGFLGSIWNDWLNWTGALFAAFFYYFFAFLLSTLGYSVAYAVWYLLMLTLLTGSIFYILRPLNSSDSKRRTLFFLGSSLLTANLFFVFQFGLVPSGSRIEFADGYSLLGWIAAGVSQFLPFLIAVLALGLLYRFEQQRSIRYYVLSLIAIGIVGLTNFLSAAMLAVAIPLIWLLQRDRHIANLKFFGFPFLLVLSLALINYLAPGTQARKLVFDSDQGKNLFETASVVGRNILLVFEGPSVFPPIVIGLIIGIAAKFNSIKGIPNSVKLTAVILIATLIATMATEVFGAEGEWHYISLRVATFLWVLTLAILAGTYLSESRHSMSIAMIGITVVTVFGALQVFLVSREIAARTDAWTSGQSAGVHYIADRATPWVNSCATQVGLGIDLPLGDQ